jgi:HipA-like protein
MLKSFKRLLSKSDDIYEANLPKTEDATFNLMVGNLTIATLHCENSIWEFKYTEEFKKQSESYTTIDGFPNIDKVYKSYSLWPFFQTRIPGLKQPAVIEILEKENIDKNNEFELLKRFGKKTISNPYELNLESL